MCIFVLFVQLLHKCFSIMCDSRYSVVELREDVEYQVQFDAGERRMAIMVSLSPEFPLEKPALRVSPPVNHPWCNEHSEITSAPGLLNVRFLFFFLDSLDLIGITKIIWFYVSVYSAQ